MKPDDGIGRFLAIDPLTCEKEWEIPLVGMPSSAGMLATAGGLVFTGKPTGEFIALDEDTGKTLWQFKTGSSINATAITYTHIAASNLNIAAQAQKSNDCKLCRESLQACLKNHSPTACNTEY